MPLKSEAASAVFDLPAAEAEMVVLDWGAIIESLLSDLKTDPTNPSA